ncbi:MerR family DNA-binding protein [Kamptonema formosum]|nr:MerR family DNA-binding protein [Kamptonema formosum]
MSFFLPLRFKFYLLFCGRAIASLLQNCPEYWQSLGLSLSEIKDILDIRDRGQLPCGEVKRHLETKVEAIAQQIEALEALKAELQGILHNWQERPSAERVSRTICPNIQLER